MTDLHPSPELEHTISNTAGSPGVGEDSDARRFRASTYDEAVVAATDRLGPNIRVVGANRIRRGGLGGFFATDLGIEISAVVDETAPAMTSDETPISNARPTSNAGPISNAGPVSNDGARLAEIDWPRDTVHLTGADPAFIHDVLELGDEGMENLLAEISRGRDVHVANSEQHMSSPPSFAEHMMNEGFNFADVVADLETESTNPHTNPDPVSPPDHVVADHEIGPSRVPEHVPSSWIAPAKPTAATDKIANEATKRRRAVETARAEREQAACDAAAAQDAEREQAQRDAAAAAQEAELVFAEREHARREERDRQRRADASKAAERTAARIDAARTDVERTRQSHAQLDADDPKPAARADTVLAELDELLRRAGVDVPEPNQIAPAEHSPTVDETRSEADTGRENLRVDPLRRPTELATEATDRLVSRLADVVAVDGSCLQDLARVRVAVTTPDGLVIEMTAEMGDNNV